MRKKKSRIMLKYLIKTYGCQMNYSDTERMETYLNALGFSKTDVLKNADIIIFNTCSIRQKAEQRVLGHMGDLALLRQKNKNLIVIITGCMTKKSSSRYSESRDKLFNRAPGLDIALRIEELPKLASLLREINPKLKINEIKEESLEDYFSIQANAKNNFQVFIPISTGCDKFCTYCIVPYSRGREKSRKVEEIVSEAKQFVENGCKEITLLGQTVNSYGLSAYDTAHDFKKDIPKNKSPFVYLLERLDELSKDGLVRVRFSSSHPKDFSDELINAIAKLKTQMPYVHLPVQAGNNDELKRMNRPYKVEDFLEIIKKLRKKIPGICISTDVIVGFCGETEEEFMDTYNMIKDCAFDLVYISQYSERKGTYASKNLKNDISEKVKKSRWLATNKLLKEVSFKNMKRFEGKKVDVLFEKYSKGENIGKSEHSKIVLVKSKKNLTGKILPIKIIEAKEWVLIGEE